MQSKEQIESFRKMTPTERWGICKDLMEFAWKRLRELPHDECERRLELARRQHNQSNEILAEKLKGMK